MDNNATMNGPERAAVLLLSLGEQDAAAVLRHMEPAEAERLGLAMSGMKKIRNEQLEVVFDSLDATLDAHAKIEGGSEEYIRSLLVNAFGENKASTLLDRIFAGGASKSLEDLKWMDTRTIADMVKGEHPQITAIVLAYLDAERAAQVLSMLPEDAAGAPDPHFP